jgi:hypothetical protein
VALRLAITVVAFGCLLGGGSDSTASMNMQVFVLVGQSNMAGRGQPLSLAAPTDPRLLIWRTSAWQLAADPRQLSTNRKGLQPGIGPGMIFGLQLVKWQPGVYVGLIMCANGGSSIRQWMPDRPLYAQCLEQIRATGIRIAGVLFLQGESEARTPDQAKTWLLNFAHVLAAFRHDTHDAPFVLGQIGTLSPQFQGQRTVRNAQAQAARLYHLLFVKTSDLPIDATTGVHFTVPAYRVIGDRFATTWWRATKVRATTQATHQP